jgi:integrase
MGSYEMPARALTDAEVRGLKASSGNRLVLYDAKARGLCLRVTARTKSWSFIYRPDGSSRQRRYTIGDYPAWSLSSAREKALTLRQAVQDGRDPVVDRKQRREALTVAAMIDRFIAKAKGRLRSWQAYEGLLKRDVVSAVGDRPAGQVTRAEIANILDTVLARSPAVANGVHSALSSVYGWAVSEGLVTDNPVRGLRRRHAAQTRERVLTDDELQRFWQVTAYIAPAYKDALRLVLLTGQRPGEVIGIRAEEVDIAKAVWRIPAARVKNKRDHVLPLTGEALRILSQLVNAETSGPLLRTPRGHEATNVSLAKAFSGLRAQGLFPDAKTTPHDLRRTAATLMGRLDIDQMTIARVLNHASTTKATVTGSTYDRHTYEPQMRRALEALDAEVRRIVEGRAEPESVVPIKREPS